MGRPEERLLCLITMFYSYSIGDLGGQTASTHYGGPVAYRRRSGGDEGTLERRALA
jgi:hypothetical protein